MNNMFDIPPRCPAVADKITAMFSWKHTYHVHQKQKEVPKNKHLHKTYSLQLPITRRKSNAGSWVIVHHLQSQSGILDPDDKLNDVADDREQILANYDECSGPDPCIPQGGGDGASGSSIGTESPEMFARNDPKFSLESTHIEVTSNEHNTSGLGLQVRRGSEPSLNHINESQIETISVINTSNHSNATKRWSAAPVCRSDTDPPERLLLHAQNNNNWSSVPEENIPSSSHNESSNSAFSRSGRLSMQFLGDGDGHRWIDAAEKVASNNSSWTRINNNYTSKTLPRETKRKEPLGQANPSYESMREKIGEMLLVLNEKDTPLGLTAIPDRENGGLLVQAVEKGGPAEKGRLRKGDRIVEINNVQLVGCSDKAVQEILKKSLASSELRLRVIRANNKRDTRVSKFIEAEEKPDTKGGQLKTSPVRKVPGVAASASLQQANTRKIGKKIEITLQKGPQGLGFSVTTRDNPAGGHCPIYIKNILPKGAAVEDGRLKPGDRLLEVDGVPMTGKSQTEVVGTLRSTLPGASVRLVVSRQVDLQDIEEREIGYNPEIETKDTPPKPPAPIMPPFKHSGSKSVPPTPPEKPNKRDSILRSNLSTSLRLKRKTPENSPNSAIYTGFKLQDNNSLFPWRNREILTFHIPVHDTEKAGLGVSVKGKTGSPNNSNDSNTSITTMKHDGDLGIFVKSVIHGGAASKDGRLRMNDQLLSVNGISLLGQSNAEAMDTLRRAMLHTGGKYPGNITLTVARRISRPASIGDPLDSEHSNVSDNSGTTIVYLNSSDNKDMLSLDMNQQRWSNPVLDRLTGGTMSQRYDSNKKQGGHSGFRNESYYMATNDTWSPTIPHLDNNSVLIEEDPEPKSPILPDPKILQNKNLLPSSPNGDVTYDSQLSLETNPSIDAFSRDAIGRRSMSEKHHAALDAKETGTYQRNKKIREQRDRDKKIKLTISNSMESLRDMTQTSRANRSEEMKQEFDDKVTDLGPSLGMKKSSSLESLQTMVQEIQMANEPRGPTSLKTPRGRGRDEALRAVVERPPENKPRKHWLLEDNTNDSEGGFINHDNKNKHMTMPANDGKYKQRQKKSNLFKGIGSMFRFGKHRKDVVAPAIVTSAVKYPTSEEVHKETENFTKSETLKQTTNTLPSMHNQQFSAPTVVTSYPTDKRTIGPPQYIGPPSPPQQLQQQQQQNTTINGKPTAIHQNDVFNHRYSHYVNYDELQHQLSRRHHAYHSTRSTRELSTTYNNSNVLNTVASVAGHSSPRPVSTYYEYETAMFQPQGSMRKDSNIPAVVHHRMHKWNRNGVIVSSNSIKNRGPFVTQVTISDSSTCTNNLNPASKV